MVRVKTPPSYRGNFGAALNMSASKLPQEMIEVIIDQLYDDNPSLKVCSLVCKSWKHPARPHLFATSTLRWPLQPALFPFVRHLCLSEKLDDGAPSWDEIVPLLVGFSRIVSLNIDLGWGSLEFINPRLWSTLAVNLSGVVSLSLMHFNSISWFSLAQIINAFSGMRDISVYFGTNWTVTELLSARLPPDLHTLELNLVNIPAWPDIPTLRKTSMYNRKETELAIVQRFLELPENASESLSSSTLIEDWARHSLDLTPLSQLRLIKFVLSVERSQNRNRWVTQALSLISSAYVEDVVFKLKIPHEPTSDDISNALEWEDVDAILQRSTFSRLRNVRFLPDQAGTGIVQRLPQCHARGILRADQL